MRTSIFSALLLVIILLSGCDSKYPNASPHRKADEFKAEEFLKVARTALNLEQYSRAKAKIKALRDSCRYALEAREQAILLMDSIYIFEMSKELQKIDSLARNVPEEQITQKQKDKRHDILQQVKFYQRKLEHDKQQRKHHD